MEEVYVRFVRRIDSGYQLLASGENPSAFIPREGDWINLHAESGEIHHTQVIRVTAHLKQRTATIVIDHVQIEVA